MSFQTYLRESKYELVQHRYNGKKLYIAAIVITDMDAFVYCCRWRYSNIAMVGDDPLKVLSTFLYA